MRDPGRTAARNIAALDFIALKKKKVLSATRSHDVGNTIYKKSNRSTGKPLPHIITLSNQKRIQRLHSLINGNKKNSHPGQVLGTSTPIDGGR
jgi:hypothetical protein